MESLRGWTVLLWRESDVCSEWPSCLNHFGVKLFVLPAISTQQISINSTKFWDIRESMVWKVCFYSHLRMVGCKAFAHVFIEQRSKLYEKSTPCICVGYGDEEFGYRSWDPEKKKINKSWDMVFHEIQTLADFVKPTKSIVSSSPNVIPDPVQQHNVPQTRKSCRMKFQM